MKDDTSNKAAIEMAYFKFAVIAPAIQGTFPDASKAAYYRRVTQEEFKLPDGRMARFRAKTPPKWEELYRKDGMDGLMPGKRSDAGTSRVIDRQTSEKIVQLVQAFPRINATMVYHRLIEDGSIKQAEVSLSSVQRFMKKNDLRSARNPQQKDRKAFEEEFPGGMYQADTSHTVYIRENGISRKAYLIHVVDDHSRLIVGARFFYEDNSYNFQRVLKEAVSRYGLCKKLYMDSGAPYRNTQLTLILGSLGIVELHAPIRDGAAKAKVERSFLTIKQTWLNGLDTSQVSSLEELNCLLSDYVRRRNTSVNRTIGETPMQRYQKGISHVRLPKSREWLEECFMNRVVRRVNNDATISIEKVSYDVPQQFIRMKVEVRFLPDQMDRAYIFHEGKRFPVRITNRVENGRTKRANAHAVDYSRMGGGEGV